MKFKARHYTKRKKYFSSLPIRVLGVNSLLVFIFAVSILGSVFFSIQVALISSKMVSFGEQEIKLLEEKKVLEEQLIKESSLSEISSKANEMGFAKDQNVVYLKTDKPIAQLP